MKFYLAGKIPKGEEIEGYIDWRQKYKSILLKSFPDLKILDPDMTEANDVSTEEDALFWFGHDARMIKEADVIIIQADHKLGVGTSQEMLIAKYFGKPVITILPKDTHHRRTNLEMRSGFVADWIHPFIKTTSDLIFENLEDTIPWLEEYQANPASKHINKIDIIDEAIKYFKSKMKPAG